MSIVRWWCAALLTLAAAGAASAQSASFSVLRVVTVLDSQPDTGPGCREREARIAELERRLAALEARLASGKVLSLLLDYPAGDEWQRPEVLPEPRRFGDFDGNLATSFASADPDETPSFWQRLGVVGPWFNYPPGEESEEPEILPAPQRCDGKFVLAQCLESWKHEWQNQNYTTAMKLATLACEIDPTCLTAQHARALSEIMTSIGGGCGTGVNCDEGRCGTIGSAHGKCLASGVTCAGSLTLECGAAVACNETNLCVAGTGCCKGSACKGSACGGCCVAGVKGNCCAAVGAATGRPLAGAAIGAAAKDDCCCTKACKCETKACPCAPTASAAKACCATGACACATKTCACSTSACACATKACCCETSACKCATKTCACSTATACKCAAKTCGCGKDCSCCKCANPAPKAKAVTLPATARFAQEFVPPMGACPWLQGLRDVYVPMPPDSRLPGAVIAVSPPTMVPGQTVSYPSVTYTPVTRGMLEAQPIGPLAMPVLPAVQPTPPAQGPIVGVMPPGLPAPEQVMRDLECVRNMAINKVQVGWQGPPMPPPGLPTVPSPARPSVHLVTPQFEAHCEKLSTTGSGENVILEGDVTLTCKRNGQTLRIQGQRVTVKLADGSFTVEGTGAVNMPAVNLPPMPPVYVPAPIQPTSYYSWPKPPETEARPPAPWQSPYARPVQAN